MGKVKRVAEQIVKVEFLISASEKRGMQRSILDMSSQEKIRMQLANTDLNFFAVENMMFNEQ